MDWRRSELPEKFQRVCELNPNASHHFTSQFNNFQAEILHLKQVQVNLIEFYFGQLGASRDVEKSVPLLRNEKFLLRITRKRIAMKLKPWVSKPG